MKMHNGERIFSRLDMAMELGFPIETIRYALNKMKAEKVTTINQINFYGAGTFGKVTDLFKTENTHEGLEITRYQPYYVVETYYIFESKINNKSIEL